MVVGSAAVTRVTTIAAPSVTAAPAPRRTWMWLRLAALVAVPATLWSVARYVALPPVTLCLFERMTGRPCPGCGMTRSVLELSQGGVAASLRMHPLGLVLAALAAGALFGTILGLIRGGDPVARFLERRGTTLVLALIVAFLGTWVVRAFVVPEWAPPPAETSMPATR